MSWQLDVALKAHCVSLGSQFSASFMQPTRAKLQQNGRERCSWEKQIHNLAMCFLMDSQLCCHAVCAESQQVGAVIWHSSYIASVSHGNTVRDLEQECFQQ